MPYTVSCGDMLRLILFILLPLTCFGQGFGSFTFDQPYLAKDVVVAINDEPLGLKYYWNQADISTNGTTIDSWDDRIQNTGLVTGGVGTITNRMDGGIALYQGASEIYMTSTNGMMMGGTNTSVWMLLRADRCQAGQSSYFLFSGEVGEGFHFVEASRTWTLAVTPGDSPSLVVNDTKEWLYEFCFSWHTNGGIWFTNGVLATNIARIPAWSEINLGSDNLSSTYARGAAFVEFRYYTNFLTQANVTWLHNYVLTNYPVYTDANQYLLAQYDVSDETYNDGDPIGSVGDQGPYNLDLTGTGTARPYWTNNAGEINDEGYAYFDGSNDNLTNWYNATYPQPSHVIAVCRPISNAAGYAAALGDNGNTATEQFLYSVGTTAVASLYAGAFLNSAAIDMFKWTVYDALFEGLFSSIKTNNVTIKTGNAGGNARINGVTIGADSLRGTFAKQAFTYLAIYTNKLNSIQASNEVQRLGTKFGITTYTRTFP